jgi:hypothetical protein
VPAESIDSRNRLDVTIAGGYIALKKSGRQSLAGRGLEEAAREGITGAGQAYRGVAGEGESGRPS